MMNFGRRIPGQETVEVKEEPRRMRIADFKNASFAGDFVFKDIQLMIPELFLLIIAGMVGLGLLLFIRIQSSAIASQYGALLDDTAAKAFSEAISGLGSLALIAVIAPLIVWAGLVGIKFLLFYPRGNKVIVERQWKSGAVRRSVETIKNNEVIFEPTPPGEPAKKIYVINPKLHRDTITGVPVIYLQEGEGQNVDLFAHKDKASIQEKDFASLCDNAFNTGLAIGDYINKKKTDEQKFGFLLQLATLGLLVVIGFLIWKQPDTIIAAMKTMLGAAPVAMIGGF